MCMLNLFKLQSIHSGLFLSFFQRQVFCNWHCLELLVYGDNKKQTNFQTALLLFHKFSTDSAPPYCLHGQRTLQPPHPVTPLILAALFRLLLCPQTVLHTLNMLLLLILTTILLDVLIYSGRCQAHSGNSMNVSSHLHHHHHPSHLLIWSRGTERLSNLLCVTQLVKSRTRMRIPIYLTSKVNSIHNTIWLNMCRLGIV